MKLLLAPFARIRGGTDFPSPKNYPWPKELADLLLKNGHEVIQVGGGEDPQITPDFRKNLPYKDVEALLEESDTFIGCDSYLQHHAWLIGKRGIVLWGMSDPLIFGHDLHLNMLKDRKYLRQNQFDWYYSSDYNNDAFPSPKEVVEALNGL